MIADRNQIDSDAARVLAEDTLRLARSRLRSLSTQRWDAASHTGELSPPHIDNLTRTRAARLWLSEYFESEFGSDDIPEAIVSENIRSPKYFHKRLHALCNVMMVSSERDDDGRPISAPTSSAWRTLAKDSLLAITTRLRRWLPDPSTERTCKLLKRLVGRHEGTYAAGELTLRIESGVMDVCRRDIWDAGFVDALCQPADTPGWYGPFDTRFGVHMVAVLEVKPERLPNDDERRRFVREAMLEAWRAQKLEKLLSRSRQADVRMIDSPNPSSDGR